jgi:hypothetical protein
MAINLVIVSLQLASVWIYIIKGYELLSLYFNRIEDPNGNGSVIDEDNVMKIRGKEI